MPARTASVLLRIVLPVLCLGLVTGCPTRPTTPEPIPQPVRIGQQVTGERGGPERFTATLVHERDAAVELLGSESVDALGIDFERQSLIVLAMGEMPSGGHWMRIRSAQYDGSRLFVQFTVNSPGEDEMVTTVLTYPFAAAAIDRLPADTILRPEADEVRGQSMPE
ncbi:MAG: protease complex subunit PrcB family protein [Phycisphaeraceae bacterium]|nr:protease complex subunit PrcB family protein [Phycisphaeraceae bacterium]